MAAKRNNAAEEFETMLRQHVLRSGGRSSSCAGFEPEMASAYLEDALGKSARLRYEDHLSGCADCRRGVIELRRLMPEAEIAPLAAPVPSRLSDYLQSLRAALAFAPWRWGLAAGAAALILAFIIIPIRQQDRMHSETAQLAAGRSESIPSATPPASAEQALARQNERQSERLTERQAAGTEDSAAKPATSSQSQAIARANRAANSVAAPPPAPGAAVEMMRADAAQPSPNVITGRVSDQAGAAVAEAQVALVDAGSQQQRAVTQTDASGQFTFNEVPQGTYNLSVQARGFQSLQISNIQPQAGQQVAARLSAGASSETVTVAAAAPAQTAAAPLPPVQAEEKSQEAREEKANAEVAQSNAQPRNQPPRNSRSAGFVPRVRAKKESSRSSEKATAAGDDETVKAMTRKVRDKTFRFENGKWIDLEFKPEYLPPRTRLTRNSAEYERLLSEQPDLKPFFDLGRVIVVWQGKVYEIR